MTKEHYNETKNVAFNLIKAIYHYYQINKDETSDIAVAFKYGEDIIIIDADKIQNIIEEAKPCTTDSAQSL